jgi:hypothetical protein
MSKEIKKSPVTVPMLADTTQASSAGALTPLSEADLDAVAGGLFNANVGVGANQAGLINIAIGNAGVLSFL